MKDNEDTIIVFTARSPERIGREGGSQAWVLNPARAKLCTWLVCTQNRHNPDYEFSDATEAHGCAFLLGRISGVRLSSEDGPKDRYMVAISEFVRVNIPNVWDHGRNPIRYGSLEELGIRLDQVGEFEPVSANGALASAREERGEGSPSSPGMLTINEAKKALAATFGVKPEAVEITIRG